MLLLYVFLVGVNGLSKGFQALGGGLLDSFFSATENPFMGLMVGILATTLVQSSSVSTSLIVALVAAPDNPVPVANAVPMIMGANIGTTVTNTLVSLGHIGRSDEFRRAFAVATCHDFFNFMAVAVFLRDIFGADLELHSVQTDAEASFSMLRLLMRPYSKES